MISISCCYKWSCINHSIRYVNFDHCWMSSPGLSSESHLFSYFVPDKSYHSIYHHVPYSVSYFFTDGDNQCIQPLSFKSAFSATYSSKKNIFYCQLWNESLTVLWAEWEPGVFRQGMFMLSIKGWAVIKTHFYLNECKLAHLLWWASCPDSSISMIDQLSSCWWLTGNGSWGRDGGRKRNETAWEKKKDRKLSKTCTRILHLIRLKGIMEFHFTQKGLSLIDINKYNCHFIFKQLF